MLSGLFLLISDTWYWYMYPFIPFFYSCYQCFYWNYSVSIILAVTCWGTDIVEVCLQIFLTGGYRRDGWYCYTSSQSHPMTSGVPPHWKTVGCITPLASCWIADLFSELRLNWNFWCSCLFIDLIFKRPGPAVLHSTFSLSSVKHNTGL